MGRRFRSRVSGNAQGARTSERRWLARRIRQGGRRQRGAGASGRGNARLEMGGGLRNRIFPLASPHQRKRDGVGAARYRPDYRPDSRPRGRTRVRNGWGVQGKPVCNPCRIWSAGRASPRCPFCAGCRAASSVARMGCGLPGRPGSLLDRTSRGPAEGQRGGQGQGSGS